VGLVGAGLLHLAVAGPPGAFVLVAAGVLSPGQAREAVDWNVLIVIRAALGFGQAMEASGAARMMSHGIVEATAPLSPCGFLGGLILAAAIFTNIVTNNGAGPSCFRLRCRSRRARDLPPALIVSIPLAASMAFSTPIGYQINLMVYGPGNYRFLDVARIGGLLQVLLWIVLLVRTPLVWPL